MNILGLTFEQLAKRLRDRFGLSRPRAAAVYRHVFRLGRTAYERLPEFSVSPALAADLRRVVRFDLPEVVEIRDDGGVTKFVSRLDDGLEVESVVVPMANHATLCVSSQVGCRLGCRFCETARMGLQRHLSAAEIVAQVCSARFALQRPVRNIVFMGMGEPLDNFDAVVQAVRVLSDQRGMDIAHRHITVSTVGPAGRIDRLAALGWPRLKLAVSLNAPDDELRAALMPVARTVSLSQLRQALRRYPLPPKGRVFLSYVLIRGINDRPEHAAALSRFVRPLAAKVNLIPYNPQADRLFQPPAEAEMLRFRDLLVAEKVFVRLRTTKGRDLMAACGQLRRRN